MLGSVIRLCNLDPNKYCFFLEFNKPAMCKISHSHFFSIMLFVLPFRTEHSTYFILSKVCHFLGRLKQKCIICLQIKFYATIQPYIVYEYSNVGRGQEHGMEGTDLNFEFKMAFLGNVVSIDRRIMDVTFFISLTHKNFSISPPPPHSCLFLVLCFVFFRRLIAHTFAGNTC